MSLELASFLIPAVFHLLRPVIERMLDDPSKTKEQVAEVLRGIQHEVASATGTPPQPKLIEAVDLARTRAGEESTNLTQSLAERISPVRQAGSRKVLLKPPSNRISLARTFFDAEPGVLILVESGSGPVHKAALEFADTLSDRVEVFVTGQAFSGGRLNRIYPPHVPNVAAGTSVSQHGGWAGTLGAFVAFTSKISDVTVPGFISAGHVLEVKDQDKRGVYSPGRPDILQLTDKHNIGEVEDYAALVSFKRIDDPERVINTADVGIARLRDDSRTWRTIVRHPETGGDLHIRNAMDDDEVIDRLKSGNFEVFKVGRTTGLTKGRLRAVSSTPIPIKIGYRNYLYGDLGLIASLEAASTFTQPGDSGALVYSKDGKAVGFVVGGSERGATLIHMANSCLASMGASLV